MSEAAVRAPRVLLSTLAVLALPWLSYAAGVALRDDARARSHVVEIRGFAYSPGTLTLVPGDTVVWVNHDLVPHTATDPGGGWDTGAIAPGDTSRLVFTARGESGYLCALHPSMRGTLITR